MKTQILLFGFLFISWSIFAQVGINTTTPDSSAVLDLNANNKGLLIPTMTTVQREAMQAAPPATGLADGLLVYDTDYKRFYFWDSSVSKWVVLNNWRKEYTANAADDEHVSIVLENSSSVGIGQSAPNSKLAVNGNISVGNTNTSAPTNGAYVDGQVRIGSGAGTTEKLEVEGNTTTTGTANADEFVGRGVTPVGGVIMYSGATDATLFSGTGLGVTGSKMEGWAICNGNNGTPDLRGKFVVGATIGEVANDGDYVYANTEQGGENTHTLTVAELPSHTHSGTTSTNGDHQHNIYFDMGNGGSGGTNPMWHDDDGGSSQCNNCFAEGHALSSSEGAHSHTFTTDNGTGGNGSHENRPPYYALYYIMRIN